MMLFQLFRFGYSLKSFYFLILLSNCWYHNGPLGAVEQAQDKT